MMNESVGLIFPHQLFQSHAIHHQCDRLILIEEQLFFKEFAFHKQKLAFHRSSMRAHEEFLSGKGIPTDYIESSDPRSDMKLLIAEISESGTSNIHIINPTDNWLEKKISSALKLTSLNLIEYENPLFINTRKDLSKFFREDKKSFFQTSFYKQERKRLGLLLDENQNPLGGKWTFDSENRKKFPKNRIPPSISFPSPNKYWLEALEYVELNFANNPGQLPKNPIYPIDSAQAITWFEEFLENRFNGFGDYEDAIVRDELILHHSVLTPMMNTGLLSPEYVINRTIDYIKTSDVPLNSAEGFVRQIIGWREFIRGMYECKGSFSRTRNYWGFKRKIPASLYDGTTGILPVDDTIKKILKTGYCHHIERLMVLGNFMLLCEFDPDEVYRWFMELFIDSYDWVMVPNIYGMSQFADGGSFATKPYISGSNYLLKMSNYPKGDWQATWDGLFWRFMNEHRSFFLKNPRLSMLVRSFDKMDKNKQMSHLEAANQFIQNLDK
jgi:deoxyribodipyrimidine photolyase-related protein